ncbi:MAG TPA: hypothetical protein VMS37_17890 [Verrucomicrobiae bacterium]|nr:hypothetical protein [Verrucomicrobiae bacterium]
MLLITGTDLLGTQGAGVFSVTLAAMAPLSGSIALTVLASSATSITAGFPGASPASSLAPGNYNIQVKFWSVTTDPNNFAQFPLTVAAQAAPPQTTLLFQFMFNYDSNIGGTPKSIRSNFVITNIKEPGSTGTTGACTLYFYGDNAPYPSTVIPTIPAGSVANFQIIELYKFNGYVLAVCGFKAQGLALVTNGYGDPIMAIPAVVMNQ